MRYSFLIKSQVIKLVNKEFTYANISLFLESGVTKSSIDFLLEIKLLTIFKIPVQHNIMADKKSIRLRKLYAKVTILRKRKNIFIQKHSVYAAATIFIRMRTL